jgi:drug/metabolite transporter (DMT)-like permease
MEFLTDRTIIIALAIVGACLATAGSLFTRGHGRRTPRLARLTLWIGYLVSLASVILFVVAGFLPSR